MHSVMMMSPGLAVIPPGALPGPVGTAELEDEGAIEPAGAVVSPPVAEASADIGKNE